MAYLLLGSKIGGEWKQTTLFSSGTIDEINKMFSARKDPWVIWYLIDSDKLQGDYNEYRQLDLLYFDLLEKYPDLLDKNYRYDPFIGFYDTVAKERGWGILKDLAENK